MNCCDYVRNKVRDMLIVVFSPPPLPIRPCQVTKSKYCHYTINFIHPLNRHCHKRSFFTLTSPLAAIAWHHRARKLTVTSHDVCKGSVQCAERPLAAVRRNIQWDQCNTQYAVIISGTWAPFAALPTPSVCITSYTTQGTQAQLMF